MLTLTVHLQHHTNLTVSEICSTVQ